MSVIKRVKKRAIRLIHSKNMLAGIGIASFLESTIVPIPLEALLVPLMQSRREKLWLIASVTTLGCLLGALLGYAIGFFVFEQMQDLIVKYIASQAQIAEFQAIIESNGFWFVFSTGVTPLPLQVATLAAGLSQYSLILFMLAVTSSRIIRYFSLAILVYYFGDKTEKLVRQYKWQTVALGITLVLIILATSIWL
jgi:membrane protein YqaA with SNARE-associated domain